MARACYPLAFALAVATLTIACASTSRGSTTGYQYGHEPETAATPKPAAVRYKLDAIRVQDGPSTVTYQGSLEVRGDRVELVLGATGERAYAGTIERDDITRMWFAEHGVPLGQLECAEDGFGMSCLPRGTRMFAAATPALRFERLVTRIQPL